MMIVAMPEFPVSWVVPVVVRTEMTEADKVHVEELKKQLANPWVCCGARRAAADCLEEIEGDYE